MEIIPYFFLHLSKTEMLENKNNIMLVRKKYIGMGMIKVAKIRNNRYYVPDESFLWFSFESRSMMPFLIKGGGLV